MFSALQYFGCAGVAYIRQCILQSALRFARHEILCCPASQIQAKRRTDYNHPPEHTTTTISNHLRKLAADGIFAWPDPRLLCAYQQPPNNRRVQVSAGDPRPSSLSLDIGLGRAHLKLRHIDFAHVGEPTEFTGSS